MTYNSNMANDDPVILKNLLFKWLYYQSCYDYASIEF